MERIHTDYEDELEKIRLNFAIYANRDGLMVIAHCLDTSNNDTGPK